MQANPKKINEVLESLGYHIEPRRPYYDDEPDGYLESDNDYLLNNNASAVALLDGGLHKFATTILNEALKTLESQGNTGIDIEAARASIEDRFGVELVENNKKFIASPSP